MNIFISAKMRRSCATHQPAAYAGFAKQRGRILFFATFLIFTLLPSPQSKAATNIDGINFKLFFQQMFALEIKKEMQGAGSDPATIKNALMTYTAYTDLTFNQAINQVLAANSSVEAYQLRKQIFGNEATLDKITSLSPGAALGALPGNRAAIDNYISIISANASRPIALSENFFASPEGINFLSAMSINRATPSGQKIAFVLMPGYAAHTVRFELFPEMVSDINTMQGRPPSRPILDDSQPLDTTYESPEKFYAAGPNRPVLFDILLPLGGELGNTVGLNADSADLFASWLNKLPAGYRDAKFILLGYSKGAPVLFEFLQRHPEFKSRVIGIVTHAGVVQGTHIARSGLEIIDGTLGAHTIGEFIDTVRAKGVESSMNSVAPFLAQFDLGFLKLPKLRQVARIYGVDTPDSDANASRILDGRELRELRDGIVDLAPYTRTRFNLLYLDNSLMAPGTFIFNLSAITDISSFASRRITDGAKFRETSLLTPRLDASYRIAFTDFSLDAWFLYLSSQQGFKLAPGGLYDTQVDLQHTKTPWLDTSPLSASLTDQELKQLWDTPGIRDRMAAAGITSFDTFRSTPRANLIAPQRRQGIYAFDLGEFKGHHWSLFTQAFHAPVNLSKEYAVWQFPRKAYMRALLQTMALYNLANNS